jgi:hypothetical protein
MAPPLTGKSLIPRPPTEGQGLNETYPCVLLVAILPFGSTLAAAPKSKNAKVTLVYQHELPNVPARASRACLSNTVRAATRLVTRIQVRIHLRDGARGGDPQSS